MDRNALIERLGQVEERIFLIYMVERWSNEDREILRKLEAEEREIKAELKK